MADSSLSDEIAVVACGGYPANEMAGQLNRLIKEFGRGKVQQAATRLIDDLTRIAHVMETYPTEYMSQPVEEIPHQLRDWATSKRNRAAELKGNARDFKRALAEKGLNSN